jgi:hypothetical protein
VTARAVLDGIKARLARRTSVYEPYVNFSPDEMNRLTGALEAVLAKHSPAKIYDECECPDGTHPEDYDYIDCDDYVGCENSLTGIGCEECCIDGDYLSQACGESHSHTLDAEKRCPTVAAIENALSPKESQ